MSEEYFKKALRDFTVDFASGGAIKAMADKGYTKTWSDAKIMSKEDERLNNIRRRKPFPTDIIKIVHEAGGIITLAHPYLIAEEVTLNGKTVTRAEYIDNLISHGLDGIEASYTYDKTSYNGPLTKEQIIQEVKEDGMLIDASFGRSTRSVLMMDNGNVVLSSLETETISERIAAINDESEE